MATIPDIKTPVVDMLPPIVIPTDEKGARVALEDEKWLRSTLVYDWELMEHLLVCYTVWFCLVSHIYIV
jgi:hypothetical protein